MQTNKTMKINFRELYNAHKDEISVGEDEFIEKCINLVESGAFSTPVKLYVVLRNAGYDINGVIEVAKVCEAEGSKLKIEQIDPDCFDLFANGHFDILAGAVQFINKTYKHKMVIGELHKYNFMEEGQVSLGAFKSWVKRQEGFYSSMLYVYDSYLRRSTRAYDNDEEFESVYQEKVGEPYDGATTVRNLTPKVVVKRKSYYKTPDERKKDICDCLNGIEPREKYRGSRLYLEIRDVKRGWNSSIARFLEAEYGVTAEMLCERESCSSAGEQM